MYTINLVFNYSNLQAMSSPNWIKNVQSLVYTTILCNNISNTFIIFLFWHQRLDPLLFGIEPPILSGRPAPVGLVITMVYIHLL
jgi:hypothetical protein